MSRMFQSSGDLIADRRYDYAQAAAADGDHAAAADLLAQALELAPKWPGAWFALGEARLALKDVEGAREAYEKCRALDPRDDQGAGVALAALGVVYEGASARMSHGYVRTLFDQYAERFDHHLVKHLAYRGPELIVDALKRACAIEGARLPLARALDLGCGTGLFAAALRDMATSLDGVDLSPRMLRMAKKRGGYDRLVEAEMLAFLESCDASRYDLIAAADVFVYAGDLAPVFAATARALRPSALLAFSIQTTEAADFVLGPERRFSHRPSHVEKTLRESEFSIVRSETASTRTENGKPVPGAIFVAARKR